MLHLTLFYKIEPQIIAHAHTVKQVIVRILLIPAKVALLHLARDDKIQ